MKCRALIITALALGSLLLSACSVIHSGGTSTANSQTAVSAQSLQAFQSTLYAFGQSQNCVKCHAATVNPLWMSANVDIAYAFARPLIDFANPSSSVFATYAGNGHCNDPICSNSANTAVVQGLLTQWAEVEVTQAGAGEAVITGTTLANPPYVTATMPIPAMLPLVTSATPAVMRFDLSQLTPANPAFAGVILEVSIQAYNSAGNEYKVFNPRIAGNIIPISVSGIHVYVRPASGTGLGLEDVNQGDQWSGLSAVAAPNALPSPLPTGPLDAIPLVIRSLGIAAQSPADVLTIGFAEIH